MNYFKRKLIGMFSTSAVVINPVFANNDWETIKYAAQHDLVPSTWQVGDTKEFVAADDNTYHVRLVDKQKGRYQYTYGVNRTTQLVFEFVELPNILCQWNYDAVWNANHNNRGGFAESLIRDSLNGEGVTPNIMLRLIPDSFKSLLEDVIYSTTSGDGSSSISTSDNKLFIACRANVISSSSPYTSEGSLWDYYAQHTTDAYRCKYRLGYSSPSAYWLASPTVGSATKCQFVTNAGAVSSDSATMYSYSAPCWAW